MYNSAEKIVARSLERFPGLRRYISRIYKQILYLIHKDKSKINLNNDISIIYLKEVFNLYQYEEIFFGYYDKSPWNKSMTHFLIHGVKKNSEQICDLLILDLENHTYKIIDQSDTWNVQQGAMMQWLTDSRVIYNKINEKNHSAYIYDIDENVYSNLDFPVQVVSPNFNEFLSLNYRRLAVVRPDYGYFKNVSNFSPDKDIAEDGIWCVNTINGKVNLIVKLSELKNKVNNHNDIKNIRVNHCYYSPDGSRFVFLFRWNSDSGDYSRLYLAEKNGRNKKVLLDHKMISHYSWISNHELIVWARTPEFGDGYIIYDIYKDNYYKLRDELSDFGDGHPTMNGKRENFIITDTYPDKGRKRHLILFDLHKNEITQIGSFFSPWKFNDKLRCDLHPRWSPDGKQLSIDTSHNGKRESAILDLSKILFE